MSTLFPLNIFKFTFQKFFQEHYQSVKGFGSRVLSGRIWVQTVCKGYQKISKVAASKVDFSLQAR